MARLNTVKRIDHPYYEIYEVRNINDTPNFKIYRVKLYLIYADGKTYTLYNQADWIDNLNLMRESGTYCSSFTHDIYVSPTSHRDIYDDINYYVSKADNNRKSKL